MACGVCAHLQVAMFLERIFAHLLVVVSVFIDTHVNARLQCTRQHRQRDVSCAVDTTHMLIHVCHVSECAHTCQMSVWVSLCECECVCVSLTTSVMFLADSLTRPESLFLHGTDSGYSAKTLAYEILRVVLIWEGGNRKQNFPPSWTNIGPCWSC